MSLELGILDFPVPWGSWLHFNSRG